MKTLITVTLSLLCVWAPSTAAQGAVEVRMQGEQSFDIHVLAIPNISREAAGEMAMQRGCEVARSQGFEYYGVNAFEASQSSREVMVREGQTVQQGGFNGVMSRMVKIEDDVYETLTFGSALLSATMTNAEGAEILRGSGEVVDARTCLVHSRPD